jgi:alpha-galactosidase
METWLKPLAAGRMAVGLFNRDEHEMTMRLNFKYIGIEGSARLRDLWAHKDLGTFNGSYTSSVPGYGVVLLRVGS